jgi:hypothetical protein
MSKIIEVIVTPEGQPTIQTKGFTGDECRQASQFIEQALGQQSGETLTGEFYQSQAAQAREELRQ